MTDIRDEVIRVLADSEGALLDRNRSLEVLLRAALRSAIEAEHRIDLIRRERDRWRERYYLLRDEHREALNEAAA